LLDLLLAEIKRNRPTASYMANLAQKLNRFNVQDYSDELKQLPMRSDIMDEPE
jgi:hypothetical protein